MAVQAIHDLIQESSISTGTGDFTVTGAVTGFFTLASVLTVGDSFYYKIEGRNPNQSQSGQVEVGEGTLLTATTFSRDRVLRSSNANAKVNFSSGGKRVIITVPAEVLRTNRVRVLRLHGQTGDTAFSHVYCGRMIPDTSSDLGCFVIEWIVRVEEAGYILSDGNGGAHHPLAGFSNGVPGAFHGNVHSDAGSVSFGSEYVVAAGEWVHLMLTLDTVNDKLRAWVNGICDGEVAFPGLPIPGGAGAGIWYIGGSDHQNGGFAIAMMRSWLRMANLTGFNLVAGHAIAPGRHASLHSSSDQTNGRPCHHFMDFNLGSKTVIPDLSPVGHSHETDATLRTHHPGYVYNTNQTTHNENWGIAVNRPVFSLSEYEIDPTCPWGQAVRESVEPAWTIPASGAVPPGCKVFDSFGRKNQNYFWHDEPTLGSTEGGSLGPLAWTVAVLNNNPAAYLNRILGHTHWGIHQGAAVPLTRDPTVAHVNVGSATQDIRCSRSLNVWGNKYLGIAPRVVDYQNWWVFHFDPVNRLLYGYHNAGAFTFLGQAVGTAADNGTWTTMRVVVSGNDFEVFVDDGGSGWTSCLTLTNATHNTATRAGMTTLYSGAPTSLARYKNFTVF